MKGRSESRHCGVSTGRTSRKTRMCEHYGTWATDHNIRPGDTYVEHVEFPGGESGYADAAGHPVRMVECASCATAHGRGHLLPGAAPVVFG